MTIPVEAVKEWLEGVPGWAGYGFEVSQGMWRDNIGNPNKRLCVLSAMGGRTSADPDLTYDNVRILFLSAQKGNADTNPLRAIVYGLRDRLKTEYKACEVAQIRLQGSPVGPGYTTEDRVWYEINVEVTS